MAATLPPNPPSSSSPNDASTFTLHVLSPSLPPPSRITLPGLSASLTIAQLKSRLADSIPSHPPPDSQRLIFGGRVLSQNDMTLKTTLNPEQDSEYSMHLVLPPAPDPPSSTSNPPPTAPPTAPANVNVNVNVNANAPSSSLPASSPLPAQERHQVPDQRMTMAAAINHDIAATLRRNIDFIRLHLNNTRVRGDAPVVDLRLPASPLEDLYPRATANPRANELISLLWDTRVERLHCQVVDLERLMDHGAIPSLDSIILVRAQVLDCMDERANNHLLRRDGLLDELLDRVLLLYRRCDRQRLQGRSQTLSPPHFLSARQDNLASVTNHATPQYQTTSQALTDAMIRTGVLSSHLQTSPHRTSPNITANGAAEPPAYILTSPEGRQSLVASPGTHIPTHGLRTTQFQPAAASNNLRFRAPHNAIPVNPAQPDTNAHVNVNAADNNNPNAAAMENAVRQAVLNQRAGHQQLGMARYIRRAWLFVRLYFFCYMFSDPGTWTRVLYVTLAVLFALLSETDIPQQVYRLVLAPIQRHLEGLIHSSPDEAGTDRPNAEQQQQQQQQPPQARNGQDMFAGARDTVRRMERSLVLFLASLVPGVGERHVEVRNNIEAARERARTEEAERQVNEHENQHGQGNGDSENTAGNEQAETADHHNAQGEHDDGHENVENRESPAAGDSYNESATHHHHNAQGENDARDSSAQQPGLENHDADSGHLHQD